MMDPKVSGIIKSLNITIPFYFQNKLLGRFILFTKDDNVEEEIIKLGSVSLDSNPSPTSRAEN